MKIKIIVVGLIVFLSISCSVQNKIDTDYFKELSPNLNIAFYDKLDTIRNSYDSNYFTKSFLKQFTDKNNVDYSKPVILKLEQDKLYLHFKDLNQKEYVLQFYGKQHKKKFVFYTNYKTINVPVLLLTKEMERFKMYVSENNEVVFEKYNVNEGMLLVFGAGHSSKSLYKFKILKNE